MDNLADAIELLLDTLMDQAVTNASRALYEAGIEARVVAEKTPLMYLLRIRSNRLTLEEHQHAEQIVNTALITTMKMHTTICENQSVH